MSEIKIEFNIVGDEFPHEEVSQILNIIPTIAYYKNEEFMGGPDKTIPMKRKECCWSIESKYTETINVVAEIKKIYDIIKDKKIELQKISKKFEVDYKFTIVIYFGYENPIIGIEREIVKFASDINAEFEFDTYI